MKVITKLSIGTGALAPVIGGLGWYLSSKEKKNEELQINDNQLWNGRIKLLEAELVRLKKENKGEEITLASKISPYGKVLFALRPDGNGFWEGDGTQQRGELEKFCIREDRETTIGAELSKKICG